MKKIKGAFVLVCALSLLLIGIFAPVILSEKPYQQNLEKASLPPGWDYPLGTDQYGRDLLARILVGTRTSVFSALLLIAILFVIGTLLGMISGYVGGIIDTIVMRIADIFLTLPGIVFAIVLSGFLGGGIKNAVLSLAVVSWPKYAKLARSQTLVIKEMAYIKAARMCGTSSIAIMIKHILPNLEGTMIITAASDMGTMIIELAALSYLGFGAAPPSADWGLMMSSSRNMFWTAPWTVLAPGAAVCLAVLIFHLLGDKIKDFFDPK